MGTGHKHAHGHDHAHGHEHGLSHGHGHGHAGHSHGPTLSAHDAPETRRSKERAILIAAALTGGFMGAEVIGGLISGSLALLADAGHMLTDFASLLLAWCAFRLARRPADWKRTYGFDRFSVLAAFVNGLTLFVIAAWILFEAVRRLRDPHEVLGGLMLWVALAGLVVNVLAFWVLSRAEGDNLNVRAAALHVMGELGRLGLRTRVLADEWAELAADPDVPAGYEPVPVPGSPECARGAEAVLVLGGDGTLLRAADLARHAGVPLLGVNLGHVGFLAEAEEDTLPEALQKLADQWLAEHPRAAGDLVRRWVGDLERYGQV